MSDINKVMGVFIPPVYSSKHQGMQNALFDGNNTVIGIMDSRVEAEALANMINSHNALAEQNKALIEALEHIKKHQEVMVGEDKMILSKLAVYNIAVKALDATS